MKKWLAALIAIVTVFVCAFSLSACEERPTKEEVTPTALGGHEGLWLYRGNTRSRTDGSEREMLMTSVTVGDKEYATEDVIIRDLYYATSAHKIFFVLSVINVENVESKAASDAESAEEHFLYLFDYELKTGKYICPLAAPATDIEIDNKNNMAYVENAAEKLLFDLEGNLLYSIHESIDYEEVYSYSLCGYSNGVFYSSYRLARWVQVDEYEYKPEYNYYIEWWEDGTTHVLETKSSFSASKAKVTKTHLYFWADRKVTSINLKTETVIENDFNDIHYSASSYVRATGSLMEIYYADDAVYVLSLAYLYKNDEDYDNKYYFTKISDEGSIVIETIDVAGNYGSEMNAYDGSLYIRICTNGRGYNKYYRYDMKSGQWSRILKNAYHGESGENYSTDSKKVVGEYKFYVTSREYGYSGFMWGPEGYCYYLNREYKGETEIIQYSFNNSYFYDDICAF